MKRTVLCMCVVLIAVIVFGPAGCTREAYTQDGSEYLLHNYLLLDADWDPESEKTGILMSWAKQEDGTYKLVHGESGQSKPMDSGRLEQYE